MVQVNLSTRNPFLPCTLGAPLVEVLRNFSHGVHRVPVVAADEPSRIMAVLTQTDANRFLASDPEKYLGKERAHASLHDLGLICGPDKLVSVTTDTKAIDAFVTMHDKGLSAVAVVDDQGAFQGCLSATDLKLITDFRFQTLLLPVVQFLEHVRKEEGRASKNFRGTCPLPLLPYHPFMNIVGDAHRLQPNSVVHSHDAAADGGEEAGRGTRAQALRGGSRHDEAPGRGLPHRHRAHCRQGSLSPTEPHSLLPLYLTQPFIFASRQ